MAVVCGLSSGLETTQRRFLKIIASLSAVGSALLPFVDGLMHAIVSMEADRGALGPVIREVVEQLDAAVCGGHLYRTAVRLLRYPGVAGRLWAVHFLAQNWEAILAVERQAVPEGQKATIWTPGAADDFLDSVESALQQKEPTLTLLILDLFQLLLPAPVIPPGSYAHTIASMLMALLSDKVCSPRCPVIQECDLLSCFIAFAGSRCGARDDSIFPSHGREPL